MSGSEREDIEALKQDIATIKRRLDALERSVDDTDVSEQEKNPEPNTQTDTARTPAPVGGIILLVLGSLLTLTVIGAIIGIPLVIIGLILVLRSDKHQREQASSTTEDIDESETEKDEPGEQSETSEEEAVEETDDDETKQEVVIKTRTQPAKTAVDSNLVLRVLTTVGTVALVLGAIFFLTLSIQNGWLSKPLQLLIGVIAGIGVAVFGSRMRLKDAYAFWGDLVTTAGAIIVYFTVYIAYALEAYQLALGVPAAVLGITLMLIAGTFLAYAAALGNRRITIAAIALGTLTFLFAEPTIASLIYVSILGIGTRVASSIRSWHWLSASSLVLANLGILSVGLSTDAFASIIALILITAISERLAYTRDEHAYLLGLGPLILSGLFSLPLAHQLGWDLGITSIVIAFISIGLAAINRSKARISRALTATLFLTIGSALLVSPEYLGITWAALAVILTVSWKRLEDAEYLYAAHVVAGIGLIAVLSQNLPAVLNAAWPAVLELPAFYLTIAMVGAYALISRMHTTIASRIYSAIATSLIVLLTFSTTIEPIAITSVLLALALVYRMVIPDAFYHVQSLVLCAIAILVAFASDLSMIAQGGVSPWLYGVMIAGIGSLNAYLRTQKIDETEQVALQAGTVLLAIFTTRLASLIFIDQALVLAWTLIAAVAIGLSALIVDRTMRYSGLLILALAIMSSMLVAFTSIVAIPLIATVIGVIALSKASRIERWVATAATIIAAILIARYIFLIVDGYLIALGWIAAGLVGVILSIRLKDQTITYSALALITLGTVKSLIEPWAGILQASQAAIPAIIGTTTIYVLARRYPEHLNRRVRNASTIVTTVFLARYIYTVADGYLIALCWIATGLVGAILSVRLKDQTITYSALALITLAVVKSSVEPWTGILQTSQLAIPAIVGTTILYLLARRYPEHLNKGIGITGISVATLLIARYIAAIATGAGVTLGWLAVGVTSLVIGITTADRNVRIAGLVLIGLAIYKAFFLDVFELELVWRVIAFVVLGIALLASALLYGKYRDRIGELF